MLNKKLIRENFSRAAPNYDEAAFVQKHAARQLFELASPFINPNAKILDLGSGTGFLAQNFPQKIFESDLSLAMLNQHQNDRKINCDFENLPFKNDSFDAIISSFSLQWLSDFETQFRQFSEILKPHGTFAFCLPAENSLEELHQASENSGCNFHFNILPKISEIKLALENCGFEEKLFHTTILKSEFDDGLSAIKSIKATGANYRNRHQIIFKNQLRQFNNFCLKNFSQPNKKVAISWNVAFFISQKSPSTL